MLPLPLELITQILLNPTIPPKTSFNIGVILATKYDYPTLRDTLLPTFQTPNLDTPSAKGQVDLLAWWVAWKAKNPSRKLEWTEGALLDASENGHMNAIDEATRMGHIAVLDWWKQSGLELRYTFDAMDFAQNHPAMLEWWRSSGLEWKVDEGKAERMKALLEAVAREGVETGFLEIEYDEAIL
ncbi:hypothetical protein HDV00_009609 [Rhizophlyctis rosea]|nr:hypothetical protein HDV00_009609 [Rhizophlyctis rosea]